MAASGFYVFRLHPGTKRPLTTERWSQVSTTDLAVVDSWFSDGEHEVGLDLYRSGLMAFDIDTPDRLPDEIRSMFRQHPTAFQSTRSNCRGRGHQVYRLPWVADEALKVGSSPKPLKGAGEVKGFNSYISLGPVHAKAAEGGRYKFLTRDIVPIPAGLLAMLPVYDRMPQEADEGADTEQGWDLTGVPEGWIECLIDYTLPTKRDHAGYRAVLMDVYREVATGCLGGDVAVAAVKRAYLQMPSARSQAQLASDFNKLKQSCARRVLNETNTKETKQT